MLAIEIVCTVWHKGDLLAMLAPPVRMVPRRPDARPRSSGLQKSGARLSAEISTTPTQKGPNMVRATPRRRFSGVRDARLATKAAMPTDATMTTQRELPARRIATPVKALPMAVAEPTVQASQPAWRPVIP